MNILRQFIMAAILSIAAGMLVGLPLILHENAPVSVNLMKSGIAGLMIGTPAGVPRAGIAAVAAPASKRSRRVIAK